MCIIHFETGLYLSTRLNNSFLRPIKKQITISVFEGLEDGQLHAGHIVLSSFDFDGGLVDVLQYLLAKVTHGELGLGKRESSLAHHRAHQRFCVNDAAQYLPKAESERVRLFLKQIATRLGSFEASLHHRLRHARRKHGESFFA